MGARSPHERHSTWRMVPWISTTLAGSVPACWCNSSMFWVTSVCSLPWRSKATRARCPALGWADQAGDWVRRQHVGSHVTHRLTTAGLALAAAGGAWTLLFPINKKLWTSSYVLFTGGCALILLAATYQLVEVHGFRKLGRPFEVLGLNAILVYMASEELAYVVDSTHFKPWLYTQVLTPFAGEILGSLLFSLTLAAATWMLAAALYRRRVFLKV